VGVREYARSMKVRFPAVAGSFYPADPDRLREMVESLLGEVAAPKVAHPRMLVVPHAGYIYSGPIAASAYATVDSGLVERVVVVGPSHFVALVGIGASGVDAFRTPLGDIPVVDGPFAGNEQAHAREHSIEVHLPFLQTILGRFELTPLVVGDASPTEVAEAIDRYLEDGSTLVVISSDLSHYLTYERAVVRDAQTTTAILHREWDALDGESACGRRGIQGALLVADRRSLAVKLLDLRNSGDTQGDRSRVVGYGAFWIG